MFGTATCLDYYWSSPREQTELLYLLRSTPATTKSAFYTEMKKVFDWSTFVKVKIGNIGTHSSRKRAYTRMRRCGISKDYADYCGRWKKRRVTDQYEDVLLPYTDAKAASALCPGGPMKYTISDENVVTEAWLDKPVSRNMLKCDELDL